ncbi:MAG: hypothetical protein EHM61_23090 [Acidobacteria bacterium]|nr:MAG: hypothetical protein EHM61_23090 [Acidobacteriota bacterium]
MVDEVQKTIRRTRQYWYADGFAEITIGLLFFVLGLIFLGQAHVPARSVYGVALQLALPVVFLLGFWLSRHVIRSLKERITYPRTGYVSYPKPSVRRRRLALAAAALIAVPIAGFLARYHPLPVNWTPLVEGLMTAVILILAGQGLKRFWVIGGFSLVLGLGLSFVHLENPDVRGSAYFYGISGLVIMICGLLTLLKYLRCSSAEEHQ